MTLYNFLDLLRNGRLDDLFSRIYGNSEKELLKQRARYLNIAEKFSLFFPEHEYIHVYSVPLSTAICGNNAEKYNGRKLSLTLSSDICAIVGFLEKEKVRIFVNDVEMKDVKIPKLSKYEGFDAYILTDIDKTIKFEKAVEMLCEAIENQYADGCVLTDFKDIENPLIRTTGSESISGYSICIVDTSFGSSEYNNSINKIIDKLDIKSFREIDEDSFYKHIPLFRKKCSDEEVMLLIRSYDEINRAEFEYEALVSGRSREFFNLVNTAPPHENNSINIGMMICRHYLRGNGAVCTDGRLIKAFVPTYMAENFASMIETIYGSGCCYITRIRLERSMEII